MLCCHPENKIVFHYLPDKLLMSSLKLEHRSSQHLCFKIKGSNNTLYYANPVIGVIPAGSQQRVDFNMKGMLLSRGSEIKDKFQIEYFFTSQKITPSSNSFRERDCQKLFLPIQLDFNKAKHTTISQSEKHPPEKLSDVRLHYNRLLSELQESEKGLTKFKLQQEGRGVNQSLIMMIVWFVMGILLTELILI